MDDQELKIREAVENIWGSLDNWTDTVQSLPYDKVLKIYNAAITAGLIKEDV